MVLLSPPFVSFPMPNFLWALPLLSAGHWVAGESVVMGSSRGGGVGSSHPVPSFPLRRKILTQGGSRGLGGGGGGHFQGAQPTPSHCQPEAKCQAQWHL